MSVRNRTFAKGHGTENDFVLLVDRDADEPLTDDQVRWICDRRAGIGADGILRAVAGRHIPEWSGDPDIWFMDYRNADGSIAEMCGNGVRVFVRHLIDEGLADGPTVPVGTRAGLRTTEVLPDGRIRVAMGPARVSTDDVRVLTADGRGVRRGSGRRRQPARGQLLRRPGRDRPAGCAHLAAGRRVPARRERRVRQRPGPRHLAMRVYERGSGETRSCGTGTVAAAAAWHHRHGELERAVDGAPGETVSYRVDVPGGTVEVELGEQTFLTGPAVIVARGELVLPASLAAPIPVA